MNLDFLKFPIGKAPSNKTPDLKEVQHWIKKIDLFPNELKTLTQDLTIEQLQWKYRPDGWSIKQIVHHCADSHMNSFIRFKLALTEDNPTIKPYFEERWAELVDSSDNQINDSINLLFYLHRKWYTLLVNLSSDDLQKTFIHPEHGTKVTLAENIGVYAWHGKHHIAHIQLALEAKGKYNKT